MRIKIDEQGPYCPKCRGRQFSRRGRLERCVACRKNLEPASRSDVRAARKADDQRRSGDTPAPRAPAPRATYSSRAPAAASGPRTAASKTSTVCPECGGTFTSVSALYRHREIIHRGRPESDFKVGKSDSSTGAAVVVAAVVALILGVIIFGGGSDDDEPTTTRADGVAETGGASAPDRVQVPDVSGLPLNRAVDQVRSADLSTVPTDCSGRDRSVLRYSNWYVVRQSPSAGRTVDADTEVTLCSVKFDD